MNKKNLLFILLLLIVIVIPACGTVEKEEVDEYRLKQLFAGTFSDGVESFDVDRYDLLMTGQRVTQDRLEDKPGLMRDLAFAWGEGDIKYHVDLPGDEESLVTTTFSGSLMAAYSYSYIVNAPAKLVSNIRYNFGIVDALRANSSGFTTDTLSVGVGIMYSLFDLFYLVVGLILASIMFFVGLLIGFVTSPIQTIFDLFPVLWGMVVTTFYAIVNFFY